MYSYFLYCNIYTVNIFLYLPYFFRSLYTCIYISCLLPFAPGIWGKLFQFSVCPARMAALIIKLTWLQTELSTSQQSGSAWSSSTDILLKLSDLSGNVAKVSCTQDSTAPPDFMLLWTSLIWQKQVEHSELTLSTWRTITCLFTCLCWLKSLVWQHFPRFEINCQKY